MLMSELPAAGNGAPPGGQTAAPAKSLGRRIRRAAVWTVGTVAALLVAGLVYQAIATAGGGRRYSPPGGRGGGRGHPVPSPGHGGRRLPGGLRRGGGR